METRWRFVIYDRREGDSYEFYLWLYDYDKTYCHKIENGLLVRILKEEGERGEPFLVLPRLFANPILEGMAEALKKVGFIAEYDNAQRITSEALAKERKEELEYFKNMNEKLILQYVK